MRTNVIATAVATLLIIAACGGKSEVIEPDPTSTEPSAASPSEPSPTPPELPATAEDPSATGAATFVRYWLEVSDFASWTGNTQLLEKISTEDCAGCRKYIDYYGQIYRAGGRLLGGRQEMTSAKVATRSGDSSVVLVRAEVKVAEGKVQTSRAAKITATPAEMNRLVFRVLRTQRGWILEEVGLDR
ncbi:DUF6318 family protein [Aeromicrobium sp. CnD17-E]|uniref:DUF6318 family protein n=1 Tax=Aeromicrobium sp. CnD17-E TaxID=2954487 RepID=UPI0035AC26DD